MKKIALLVIFSMFAVTNLYAKDIQLTCNPNTDPDLAGYKIYQSSISGQYSKVTNLALNLVTGPNIQPFFDIFDLVEDGRTVYFVATAYDTEGNESGFSNEVAYRVVDNTAPQIPTMFDLVQQIANALTNISNNGLRVRIEN
jgi:hypothetical protein